MIHGSIYHNLGALTPAGTPPTFLQVYFHDGLQLPVATTEKETILISLLRAELQEHNAYLLHRVYGYTAAVQSNAVLRRT